MIPSRKRAPNALDLLVQAEFARLNAKKTSNIQDLPLWDFITTASPMLHGKKTVAPVHMDAVLPYFEIAETSPTLFCFSAPPRHSKSTIINHFVAKMMIKHPEYRVAYGSYSLDLAENFTEQIKTIMTNNGIPLDKNHNTRNEWNLENGASIKAVAPGTSFTGRGADLIIIDDPYKDRQHAMSGAVRKTTWDWVSDVCLTRRSPTASLIVSHTRWAYEDIIGVLSREHDIPYVNIPAINENGEALWESQYSLEALKAQRKLGGEHSWAAMYMGSPLPAGGAVFNGVNYYDATT